MGIDSDSDRAANLVIGPTSLGMVRIYVEAEGVDLPMDFEPDEALEIAEELRAAADAARAQATRRPGGPDQQAARRSGAPEPQSARLPGGPDPQAAQRPDPQGATHKGGRRAR